MPSLPRLDTSFMPSTRRLSSGFVMFPPRAFSIGPKFSVNAICCSSLMRWPWNTSTPKRSIAPSICSASAGVKGLVRSTPDTRAPIAGRIDSNEIAIGRPFNFIGDASQIHGQTAPGSWHGLGIMLVYKRPGRQTERLRGETATRAFKWFMSDIGYQQFDVRAGSLLNKSSVSNGSETIRSSSRDLVQINLRSRHFDECFRRRRSAWFMSVIDAVDGIHHPDRRPVRRPTSSTGRATAPSR